MNTAAQNTTPTAALSLMRARTAQPSASKVRRTPIMRILTNIPGVPTTPEGCTSMRPATGSDAVDAIIYAAHRIRTATDSALREHGLSLSGLKLLKALRDGDRSMREISQALHVSPRTVTDIIDGLEARDLVARGPHPSDRRVTMLHLTEAGTREMDGANTQAERVAAHAISGLGEREQHILSGLLERVCVPEGQPAQ
jgi:DNA-binding MarR family transcriptional regulator